MARRAAAAVEQQEEAAAPDDRQAKLEALKAAKAALEDELSLDDQIKKAEAELEEARKRQAIQAKRFPQSGTFRLTERSYCRPQPGADPELLEPGSLVTIVNDVPGDSWERVS